MRALLRDPTKIFTELEEKREPYLITRRGKPVAALVPITPDQVENLVLAASPDLLESRDAVGSARGEGRAVPLEPPDVEEEAEIGRTIPFAEPFGFDRSEE